MQVERNVLYYGDVKVEIEFVREGDRIIITPDGFRNMFLRMSSLLVAELKLKQEAIPSQQHTIEIPPVPEQPVNKENIPDGSIPTTQIVVDPLDWRQDQIDNMKLIKSTMNITDNDDFDIWVNKWSKGNITKFNILTPATIDDFIKYMLVNACGR
jgi:hypothetical protein